MSTVVFSGSLGSTGAMWDAQLPALPEGFEIVTLEHPGHGGAPLVDVSDIGDLARHALEQLPPRFSFVGLSLGGAVAMQLALDAPERVERLVLASTSAQFGDPQQWLDRAETVRRDGIEAIVDAVLERWFSPGFPDVPRFREMLLSTDREGYARCCDALSRWDARDELHRIEAPTLVVSGADDPSTPPEHLELLAQRIPNARLETIEHARHLANVERADEFNALLWAFL